MFIIIENSFTFHLIDRPASLDKHALTTEVISAFYMLPHFLHRHRVSILAGAFGALCVVIAYDFAPGTFTKF